MNLPVRQSETTAGYQPRLKESPSASESAIPNGRILVIEVDTARRHLLTDMLTMSGHSVLTCESLNTAHDLIRVQPVKLVVLDVDLPGSEEWLDVIQKDFREVMLIATTASVDVNRAVQMMQRGATDYLVRPFKIGDIVQAVERGLAKQVSKADQFEIQAALSLYGLADDLGNQVELDRTLALLGQTALEEVMADSISLILSQPGARCPVSHCGLAPRLMQDDITTLAHAREVPIALSGAAVFDYLHPSEGTEDIQSIVFMPLVAQKECMGWMIAARIQGRVFSEGDRKLLTILADRAGVAIHNAHLFDTLETSFQQTIEALIATLEEKDEYTAGHSERVAGFARLIAETLGLDTKQVELVHQGARLHDIGKLAIRTEDLNKPGPLSDDEYERMKLHTVSGEALLKPIPFFQAIIPAVGSHHERLDGSGYPRGLKGDEIPLLARIVAVADAFDAMTSDRAYRQAMPKEMAIAELRRCSGTHYDNSCVEALALNILSICN
jgi:putative nucleotidyltransferase with HDIG domain